MAPLARIVISKPVNELVPDGGEHLDQQRLTERNPDVVDDKIAAAEVGKVQVLHLPDRIGMLGQATMQDRPRGHVKAEPALSGASGNGLSNVNRNLALTLRP